MELRGRGYPPLYDTLTCIVHGIVQATLFRQYRIAGNFRARQIFVVEQYLVTSWIIFLWLLALQVKVVKVASFVSNIVHHENQNMLPTPPPGNYQLHVHVYGTYIASKAKLVDVHDLFEWSILWLVYNYSHDTILIILTIGVCLCFISLLCSCWTVFLCRPFVASTPHTPHTSHTPYTPSPPHTPPHSSLVPTLTRHTTPYQSRLTTPTE